MSYSSFKVNVSAVIKNSSGEVLMVRRSDDEEVFPGHWGIPGGTVEPTDRDLESALRRECTEEVGIDIDTIQPLANNIRSQDGRASLYIVYTAEYKDGTPMALDGTAEVAWLALDAIRNLRLTPSTLDNIEDSFAGQ